MKNKNWQEILKQSKTNYKNNNVPYQKIKRIYPPQPISEEERIARVHARAEDQGFFLEMIQWLKNNAPRKIDHVLTELWLYKEPTATYELMCKLIYMLGFRTSELLERRMILGQNNEWVQKYFEDFPIRE